MAYVHDVVAVCNGEVSRMAEGCGERRRNLSLGYVAHGPVAIEIGFHVLVIF